MVFVAENKYIIGIVSSTGWWHFGCDGKGTSMGKGSGKDGERVEVGQNSFILIIFIVLKL